MFDKGSSLTVLESSLVKGGGGINKIRCIIAPQVTCHYSAPGKLELVKLI